MKDFLGRTYLGFLGTNLSRRVAGRPNQMRRSRVGVICDFKHDLTERTIYLVNGDSQG